MFVLRPLKFILSPQAYEPPAAAVKPAQNLKLIPGKDTVPYSVLKGKFDPRLKLLFLSAYQKIPVLCPFSVPF